LNSTEEILADVFREEYINSVPQKKKKVLWFTWELRVRSKDRL